MSTVELTFANWLEIGGFVDESAQMRELWIELLHTYGPRAATEYPYIDHRPKAHDLPYEEVAHLLQTLPQDGDILNTAWCNLVASASHDVVEQMIRAGFDHGEARKVALPNLVHMALSSNPRTSRGLLTPLVDEGLLLSADISGVPPLTRPPMRGGGGNNYRWEDDNALQKLAQTIQAQLGEDFGAWHLFFELWDGDSTVWELLDRD